jgi:hypothetical protein
MHQSIPVRQRHSGFQVVTGERFTPDGPQNGRTVGFPPSMTPCLIGTPVRWVLRVWV